MLDRLHPSDTAQLEECAERFGNPLGSKSPENNRVPGSIYLRLIFAFVAVGGWCRVAQYVSNQSFYSEEVALLMNLQQHSAREVAFVKLESMSAAMPQAAPPVFLWATKWMGDTFGYSEWSVRSLPLLCSLAALVLFANLAWRLAPGAAAVWAVAMFAFCDPIFFESATAKPYSGDVLAATLIAWVGMAWRPATANLAAAPGRRLLAASLVTAVCLWFSYPAVFVFAGLSVAIWSQMRRGGMSALVRWSLYLLPAVISFLVVYCISMRIQNTTDMMIHWMSRFPNYAHPGLLPGWAIGLTWDMFRIAFYPLGGLLLFAAILGIWILWKKPAHSLLILLAAPMALTFFAGCLGQYPWGGTRLTMFLIPFQCLLAGIGIAALRDLLPGPWRLIQLIPAAVPATMIVLAVYHLAIPRSHGDMRQAAKYLADHRAAGEAVYVMGPQSVEEARWFLPQADSGILSMENPSAPISVHQFWMVFSFEPRRFDDVKPALARPGYTIDAKRSLRAPGVNVLWFVADAAPAAEAGE